MREASIGKASLMVVVRQPSMLVKSSVSTETTMSVTVSFTVRDMEVKEEAPLFFNSISTHQPTHVSRPA